jgi:glycolate oxidase iron-sulfur subunit
MMEALTNPVWARWTYFVARLLRSTGLAAGLGRIVPGRIGQAFRLLAATRPAFYRHPPIEPDLVNAAPGAQPLEDAGSFALLTGCVMEGLFGHVHRATRRTLGRAGYREVDVADQACCGALHAHAGLMEEARQRARANIEAFERADCDWIVTNSAGCGAGLRDYPTWLAEDPAWHERAVAFAARVRDVAEVLAASRLPQTARGQMSLQGRVAYDAPCHLHHGQGVKEEPLAVLDSIPDLEVTALPSSDRCCGGAGLYNLTHPEIATLVRAPKLDEARNGDFDWIATGNPGCIMYIGAGLLKSGDRTPVVHPVELVDRAWS